MAVPSIKGTAYNSVHDDLHKMLDEGRVSRDELEAQLTKEEIEVFESKVLATKWYPIAMYRKMLAMIADREGKGRVEEYLVERGWRAAERLNQAGIYRQLAADDGKGKSWGARVENLVTKISGLLYNFTKWSVEGRDNPKEFTVVIEDAVDFCDECRFTAQGFVSFAATLMADAPVSISSKRESPGRIAYAIRRK